VPESEVAANVRVSADLGRHREWLQEYIDLGFDDLFVHHVGQDNSAFIDAFGKSVLPQLQSAA
jgi:coenzyme F420-dependent glucose-6-phosphate dehydrogenase